jgi:2'-5' RNA ligase
LEGRERLRLFVALLLPGEAVARLVEWQERELGGRPDLRIVPADNLHVTVAFLGGRRRSQAAFSTASNAWASTSANGAIGFRT